MDLAIGVRIPTSQPCYNLNMHDLFIIFNLPVSVLHAVFTWFQNFTGTNNGLNPGSTKWYNFHSGFEGDLGIYAAIFLFYYHHQCHQHKCWHWARHATADGTKVCKTHHPDMGKGFKITAEHILHHHKLHLKAKGIK